MSLIRKIIWMQSALVGMGLLLGFGAAAEEGSALSTALSASLKDRESRGFLTVEPAAPIPDQKWVLRGATVFTGTGPRLSPGYLVIDKGRIVQVGAGEPVVPEGARVVDAEGQFITPGLIDTHSHIGVYPGPDSSGNEDGNEMTSPLTAGVWAEHSLWPQDPQLEWAVRGGVTSMQVLPGSANLVGGRGVIVHNVPARGSRAMRFPGAPETVKMACGENPKRVYGTGKGQTPDTRMGNLRGQREAFMAAQRYLEAWRAWEKKKEDFNAKNTSKKAKKGKIPEEFLEPSPERDLDMETLVGVLKGEILPQIHCYRADDMLSMLQVADEFGFRVRSFHHALEAYKIRDLLVQRQVAVSTWADWWGFKMEAWDGIPENLALVTEAGGRAIVHSDSPVGIQRLNQEAAKGLTSARRAGISLTEEDALRWVTINPAWALGIDGEVGTLEVGKRADVVVWEGSPLSVYGRARLVLIDGALRFDASEPQVWSDFMVGTEVSP